MPIEIRAIGPDEVDALIVADQRGFGGVPVRPESRRGWATAELDRTRIAFESGEIVGVSRTYTFELTMPGGALLPAAAVSWVSVLPTHRRRGVLTQMMAAMHADARERGEPAAILTASESSIYGRFGYGIATWQFGLTAQKARVAFRAADDDDGHMRLVDREEAERVLPQIYERTRRVRAGMVSRPEFWWGQVFWDFMVHRVKANFVAIHSDAQGNDDGYVVYGIAPDADGGMMDRQLSILDIQSVSPPTWIALWRFVFGVDLIGTVSTSILPTDDPLRHVVLDSRRVRVNAVHDHLWLAPLDPVAVLGARTYAVPGRVVIESRAPDGSSTTTAIESGAGGATASATTAAPRTGLRVAGIGDVCARRQPLERSRRGRTRRRAPAGSCSRSPTRCSSPPPPPHCSRTSNPPPKNRTVVSCGRIEPTTHDSSRG